jgi:hypothetical protein
MASISPRTRLVLQLPKKNKNISFCLVQGAAAGTKLGNKMQLIAHCVRGQKASAEIDGSIDFGGRRQKGGAIKSAGAR